MLEVVISVRLEQSHGGDNCF